MTADDFPTTEELKAVQLDRLDEEREAAADEPPDDAAERTHGRRADKAKYLADKRAEQEQREP